MSTHEVLVVRINEFQVHPNADSLQLIEINGYTACVRIGDYSVGQLVAYIEPDYVVPDTDLFAFLGGRRRIKCRRLRGVMSHGLVMPAPEGAAEGDNVMELMGITRYEPPVRGAAAGMMGRGGPRGDGSPPPPGVQTSKYDLENFRKYKHMFADGELVEVTEKLHGANARYVYIREEDKLYCGSRTLWWKKPEDECKNLWWEAAEQNEWVEAWCRENPNHVLYGEVFGDVQDLKYGAKAKEFKFLAFDILTPSGFLSSTYFRQVVREEHRTPLVYLGPLDKVSVMALADGNTLVPGAGKQIREGVVIKPMEERYDPRYGRAALKLVSDDYLERSK